MCRFIAYKGKSPILLKKVISEAKNSLVNQSHFAKKTKTGINGDGFGIGWYDLKVDEFPAVFKSIQPAWNDENLVNLASKVKSNCFIGHVRASTVGEVGMANCHPFSYKQYLFAHNGTIDHFDKIKRNLLQILKEEHYANIHGQTDSEHFFALVCNYLENSNSIAEAVMRGIEELRKLFKSQNIEPEYRLNTVFTNGKEMVITRIISDKEHPSPSLYRLTDEDGAMIASEPLTESNNWEEIPVNTIFTIDKDLKVVGDIS